MDDNIWEYPFGDIDEDEDVFFRRPDHSEIRSNRPAERSHAHRPF